MPSTRRQKAKARKSREMDMRSNDNNRDMMLGGINSNSIKRKFEIIINHSLGQGGLHRGHSYLQNCFREN